MNEKLSFQNLVDALATKSGVSKKVAEAFAKSFFDTIVEALYMGENVIKIKGLGSFKLVDVESRESVNVSNGERIVIPGYKKVSFTPDDAVVESLNKVDNATDESSDEDDDSADEDAEDGEGSSSDEIMVDSEEISYSSNETEPSTDDDSEDSVNEEEIATSSNVISQDDATDSVQEQLLDIINDVTINSVEKTDNLSNIDMLISTPESVEEVRQQLAEATEKSNEAIENAKKANAERIRLEMLLSRLENNTTPEGETSVDETEDEAPSVPVVDVESTENLIPFDDDENNQPEENAVETGEVVSEESESEESSNEIVAEDNALNRLLARQAIESAASRESEEGDDEDEEIVEGKSKKIWLWIVASLFAIALIACIVFFLRKTSESIESVGQLPPLEEKTVNPLDSLKMMRDSLQRQQEEAKKDSIVASEIEKKDTIAKPVVAKEEAPSRPKTYVLQPGESLTRLSVRFYGTKDSVNAIIRANSFPDPNNVPAGATVKLP